ncbi:MAG: DNA replication/repair protein RecF [Gammaproteobacteria bacterium]|nr:DNA replication/repair protein RecF [Gammaproteobacteria bacterium]MBQ0839275.1 DNA replication/repair protein RecF [Gammaproteobacteria bacterium]
MYLTRLDVHGIRNISSASFSPIDGINVFYGANGSGKTSILEAIYLLGRGRTFRSRHTKTLINHKARECTVFGAANSTGQAAVAYTVGVTREATGSFQFKVDGRRVTTSSSLADAVPLLLMNSESFLLVEGGPGGRRRFLDWGVFHVEQQFQSVWAQFQRSLQQRNKLLRHDKIAEQELVSWDDSFIRLSKHLTEMRRGYFKRIEPVFHELIDKLTSVKGVSLSFYQGWDDNRSLESLLAENIERDIRRNTTSVGPHRADIKILVDGRDAGEVLSRGQTKALVAALIVGQGQMFREAKEKQCIYLFDDLVSELDNDYLLRLLKVLASAKAQVFITGTDYVPLIKVLENEKIKDCAVFHVEHGTVNSLNALDLKGEAQ